MPEQTPASRVYYPFPSSGTGMRSFDKEAERALLHSAFLQIEAGNLEDGAITERVIGDDQVGLAKLTPEVRGLIGSGVAIVRQSFTPSASQTNFTLSIAPPTPSEAIITLNGIELEFSVDYTISGTLLTYLDGAIDLTSEDRLKVRFFIQQGTFSHDHNDIYYTKTELSGPTGTTLIGDTDSYSAFDPSPTTPVTLKNLLTGINSFLSLACQIKFGFYTGDGVDDRIVTVGFTPKVVIISKANGANSTFAWKNDSMTGKLTVIFANDVNTIDSIDAIAISGNDFTVDDTENTNEIGEIYHWVALK